MSDDVGTSFVTSSVASFVDVDLPPPRSAGARVLIGLWGGGEGEGGNLTRSSPSPPNPLPPSPPSPAFRLSRTQRAPRASRDVIPLGRKVVEEEEEEENGIFHSEKSVA